MKISLSLLSVGMIAAAASAGNADINIIDAASVGLSASQDNGQRFAAFRARKSQEATDTLFSTNFDSYTTGAICTDLTGTTPGQGGWYQYQTATTNNWSIASQTGTNTKYAKQAWGSATAAGQYSYLYQDNGGAGYGAFTAGRGVEVDFSSTRFANTVSTNKGNLQLRTYDASGTKTPTGMIIDNYQTGTNYSIRGLASLTVGGVVGTYSFTLGTSGTTTTSTGVSHDYYAAYDSTTGNIFWGWDQGLSTETNYYYAGAEIIAGQVMFEADFLGNRNSSTTAGYMKLDDVSIYAYDIPAPGAIALVGLAGIMARRRRA